MTASRSRFLGLGLEDRVPDAKTVWLYREHLAQAGVIEALFDAFDGSLKKRGYLAMGGQIIDASIVPVPQQRNSRDENARIKDGETPEGWEKQPAKRRQKDTDARWTKKHGKSHYGYKNHVNVDRRHKLVRRYQVTDAAVHDSQVVEDILDADNTASDVWADSAYRSAEIEAKLGEKGLKSRIHRKGHRNKPLNEREKRGNETRSKVRARVEHVFGAQSNDMGGTLVRGIGLVRAKARIGLKNLAYNMRRLVQLEASRRRRHRDGIQGRSPCRLRVSASNQPLRSDRTPKSRGRVTSAAPVRAHLGIFRGALESFWSILARKTLGLAATQQAMQHLGINDAALEVAAPHLCSGKVGVSQVGAAQIGFRKIGQGQQRAFQIGIEEHGLAQIGAAQVGARHIGTGKVGAVQIGIAQIHSAKIDVAQVARGQFGPVAVPVPRFPGAVFG